MEKAAKMGKDSTTGSFQLFVGRIASTLILGIGTIIVGLFIDQGEYGLYTISLVPAATFLLFQDWGVSSALTKYCASYRAAKMEGELRKTIAAGLIFEAATGIGLTLLLFLTASLVASTMLSTPESAFLVTISSITIFSTAIYGASLSVITGFERMELSTVIMIVAATVQGSVNPLLVYLGFGALGAVIGNTLASIASGVTAVSLLYFVILRKLPSGATNETKIFQTLKPLLHFGIPVSVATIIGGATTQIYYFVMASSTEVTMIGNFSVANNFAVFLTFFIYPIQTVLFPAFSRLDPTREKQLLKTVFASSVKYSSLFLVPATIALMVLSTPLISTIYGDKWPYAPFFLTLGIAGNLIVLLGNISYGRLLYATGETKMMLKLSVLTFCIGVPLAFLLIPPLGITGVIIISSLSAGWPGMIIGMYWMWKRYEVKVDLRNSTRIFLASSIAGIATFLFLNAYMAAAWIMLTSGAIIFLVAYVVSIALIGAVNQSDIRNLQVMFSGLGPVSKPLHALLALIEVPLRIKEKLSRTRQEN